MNHVVAALALTISVALAPTVAPGLRAQERPFPLEGLIVTASPNPRPAESVAAHVTVLEGDALRRSGFLGVADALRSVAGMTVVRGGSYGATTSVFLRGGESDYVQVLVDGVAVNQPGGSFDFASLTLEHVERIEIVRGPMSALYGSDAVAGVIHVITRTGSGEPSVELSARGGSHGRVDGRVSVQGGSARVGYGLSVARTRTDGILPFNNRHENRVISGTVRLAPDPVTRADLTFRLSDRLYHFPTDGSGAVVDENQFTFGDETTVGLHARRALGPRWSVGARVSAHQFDGGTDDQPDGPADTLGFYGFTSLDHVRRVATDLTAGARVGTGSATFGLELEDQGQRSFTESSSEFGTSAGRSRYERSNRALYAHFVQDGARLAWNAGGRVESNERFGDFVTWQVGASWRPAGHVRVRGAAGRGIKEPTFFETFATGFARGNPELEPERSTSVEAGTEVDLGGGVTLTATAFRQRFTDLIQYTASTPSPNDPNYFNVAEARASGVEFGARLRRGALSASLDWTRLATEVLDGGFDEGPDAAFAPGEELLRRPGNRLDLALALDRGGRLALGAELHMVGTRVDRDFSTFPAVRVELPTYVTLGAWTELRLVDGDGGLPATSLTFRGDNLLDESYQEVLGFDAPGRALVVGARIGVGG